MTHYLVRLLALQIHILETLMSQEELLNAMMDVNDNFVDFDDD